MNLRNEVSNIGLNDFILDETVQDLQTYLDFLEQENKRLRNIITTLSDKKVEIK